MDGYCHLLIYFLSQFVRSVKPDLFLIIIACRRNWGLRKSKRDDGVTQYPGRFPRLDYRGISSEFLIPDVMFVYQDTPMY